MLKAAWAHCQDDWDVAQLRILKGGFADLRLKDKAEKDKAKG